MRASARRRAGLEDPCIAVRKDSDGLRDVLIGRRRPTAARYDRRAVDAQDDAAVEPTAALLAGFARGDSGAQERLFDVVRAELQRVAGGLMKEQPAAHTLQPTALVHEAWIRLVQSSARTYENRGHFLGVASKAMRTVLVDHVRAKRARKRSAPIVGAGDSSAGLDEVVAELEAGDTDLLDLEDALVELERTDPELLRIVEMRFFGGLSHPDVASTLGVSLSKVESMWRIARAWLHRRIGSTGVPE